MSTDSTVGKIDILNEVTEFPVYRAQKVGSNEYIIGYYADGFIFPKGALWSQSYWVSIKLETLAIHLPDMIDSKGHKIFAALNKTGVGGDILNKSVKGNTKECIAKFSSRLGFHLDTGKFSLPFSSDIIFTMIGIKQ